MHSSYFSLFDPTIARNLNAIYGINIPRAAADRPVPWSSRQCLIAAPGTPPGPPADLLRLTPVSSNTT